MEQKMRAGFVLALASAILLAGLAHYNTQHLMRIGSVLIHTRDVAQEIDQTLTALMAAQGEQQGYLIAGDRTSLTRYTQDEKSLDTHLETLQRLTANDPAIHTEIIHIGIRAHASLSDLSRIIGLQQTQGADAARRAVLAGVGQADMDAAREAIEAAVVHEKQVWDRQQRQRDRSIQVRQWVVGMLIGGEFLLLLWAYRLFRHDAAGRAHARAVQEEQDRELEAQHEEMLAQQNDLVVAARDLSASNARLEYASRRFEELYQGLPVPCFCHDAEGRIFEWNRAFETCYGLTSDQVFQRHIWDVIAAPEEQENMRAAISRAFSGVPQDDWELTLHGSEGALRYLLCNTVPMRGPAGQITGGISTHLDITERKVMEETLQKERGFLSALLDNLQEGIVACDAEGTLTLFNRATCEFHGLPEAPLPPDQWAEHFALYEADGLTPMPTEAIPLFRAFRGERVSDGEMVIAPHNGPARTLLASGQAILDAEGRKIGAVVAMHDITWRKSVEEALRVSEERLRAFHDITAAPEDERDEKIENLLRLGCHEFGLTIGIVAERDEEHYPIRHIVSTDPSGGLGSVGLSSVYDCQDTLCHHMLQSGQPLAIEDLGVTQWHEHPSYTRLGVAAYFGSPLQAAGADWGALCFLGTTPHAVFAPAETDFLRLIAQWIGGEIERRRSRQRVLDSEARFRSAIRSMQEGFIVQDTAGTVLLCNEAAGRTLHVPAEEMLSQSVIRPEWRIIRTDGTDFPPAEQPSYRALTTGRPEQNVSLGIQYPDGDVVWLSMNAAPLYQAGEDAPYAAVITFTDITERRAQEAQIAAQMDQIRDYNLALESQKQEMEVQRQKLEMQKRILERTNLSLEVANSALESLATLDGLTGLKNHRTFQSLLEVEVRRCQRYAEPLSLIMLDVDYFKQYNDAYGHPAGDEVLRAVGMLLEQNNRDVDTAARYGGEEFAVILPNTDSEGARSAAERLREAIAAQDWPCRPITASLGVSTLLLSMTDQTDMISAADAALYRAKANGRNQAVHAMDPVTDSSALAGRSAAR